MSATERGKGSGTMLPLLLGTLVMVSAVAVVQVKQHSRNLTTRLDGMRQDRERLQVEWAQLQLEQATLAQHGRVDQLARSQFGMVDPLDYQIVSDSGAAMPLLAPAAAQATSTEKAQ